MKDSPVEVLGDDWQGAAILNEVRRLRKTIQPISSKYHFPNEPVKSQNTRLPFVLMLGNHSSGKSSFINHLLGKKIQETGVAPTDDGFTIIGHAVEDVDRNGPALVGDPDLGFQGLSAFGPTLVSHTQLKLRRDVLVRDFFIVDSPGMIDSPLSPSLSHQNNAATVERGYNFEAVVRWYAERADVILFTFDPEKPGSTGETLSILTSSLAGLDHKLFIILNKADQFKKMHDFARAYGSLCWNLSKVIPRKDLPRIYTMCLPAYATQITAEEPHRESFVPVQQRLALGFADLEDARNEVIKEVFNAPKRRVDNELSRFTDMLHTLSLHCRVVDRVAALYTSRWWSARLTSAACITLSVGLTLAVSKLCDVLCVDNAPTESAPILSVAVSESVETAAPRTLAQALWEWVSQHRKQAAVLCAASLGALSSAVVCALQEHSLSQYARTFSNKANMLSLVRDVLDNEPQSVFSHNASTQQDEQFALRDEYTHTLGEKVALSLCARLSSTKTVRALPRVRGEDLAAIERILSEDVANLRRSAMPAQHDAVPHDVSATVDTVVVRQRESAREERFAVDEHLRAEKEVHGVHGGSSSSTDTEDCDDDEKKIN